MASLNISKYVGGKKIQWKQDGLSFEGQRLLTNISRVEGEVDVPEAGGHEMNKFK